MAKNNKAKALAVTLALMAAAAGGGYLYLSHEGELGQRISEFSEKIVTTTHGSDESRADETGILVNYNETDSAEEEKAADESELKDVETPYAADYFLSTLSSEEQTVCKQLYNGFRNFETKIAITNGVIKEEDICDFIMLCTYCAPEFDYLGMEYSVSVNGDGYVISIEVSYTKTPEEVKAQQQETQQAVDLIMEGVQPQWGDYDKFKYFHDTVILTCQYDETAENCYSAYGCLVEGKAVCEGYTKALLMLCEKAGIGCLPVMGDGIEEGQPQSHSWNYVMLDGEWYATDLTWDDPVSDIGDDYMRYDYFAVTDRQMNIDHVPDENKYMKYPEAKSLENEYYRRGGFYLDNAELSPEVVKRAVSSAMYNNENYARVKCADSDVFNACIKTVFEDDYDGNPMIFSILKQCSELYPENVYDYTGYSIIKNESTHTITVKLKRSE